MFNQLFNNVDLELIALSIKVLSKSNYSGLDLVSRIYDASFSNGSFILENFSDVKNLKASPSFVGSFSKNKLVIGDLLFADNQLYIVGENNDFYDTNNHLKRIEYNFLLKSLPKTDCVLVRPSIIMPNYSILDTNEKEVEIGRYQQAVLTTAKSFFLRGDNIQYEDSYFINVPEERSSFGKTPEHYTYQNTGYSNCAMFANDVYFSTFNEPLPLDMYLTRNLASFAKDAKMEVYRLDLRLAKEYNEEQRRAEIERFLSILQPADLINFRRYYSDTGKTSGHVVLYIGNGRFIHSTGGWLVHPSENIPHVLDPREATIRFGNLYNYLLCPSSKNYIFGGIIFFVNVIRPLASPFYANKLPKSTKARVKNLKGVRVDKLSSHPKGKTVNVGEKICYTFSIFNTNNYPISLEIKDRVPSNTTYVSGGDSVINDWIFFRVMAQPNQTKKVSFIVKINENAKKGGIIYSSHATVSGVPLYCPAIFIENTLTKEQQKDFLKELKCLKKNSMLKLVNEVYYKVLGKTVFSQTDARALLIGKNGIFKEYKQGYYEINKKSPTIKMLIRNLCSDTFNKTFGRAMIGGTKLVVTKAPFIRTEDVTEHNLIIGDVLVVLGEKIEVLIYCGYKKFRSLANGVEKDELEFETRCVRLLESDLFAILRPSMILK